MKLYRKPIESEKIPFSFKDCWKSRLSQHCSLQVGGDIGLPVSGEARGRVVGAILYPVEVAGLRLLSRGPSTEIFICRRES